MEQALCMYLYWENPEWYGVDLNTDKNDFPFDSLDSNKMIFIRSMYTSCCFGSQTYLYISISVQYYSYMWVILL